VSDGSLVPRPDVRLSDDEREAVVERLRLACGEGRITLDEMEERVGEVYRARTAAQLEPVTADLPEPSTPRRPLRETDKVVGVFSGARHTGPWRPAPYTKAVAVCGACQLDLTDLAFDSQELVIRANVVMGSVEVIVPEGTTVHLEGYAVLGSKHDRVRSATPHPAMPVVVVDVRAIMGSVVVRSKAFPRRSR